MFVHLGSYSLSTNLILLIEDKQNVRRQIKINSAFKNLQKALPFLHMIWNSSTKSPNNWHAFDGALVNHVTCHVVEIYVKDFIGTYETLVKNTKGGERVDVQTII